MGCCGMHSGAWPIGEGEKGQEGQCCHQLKTSKEEATARQSASIQPSLANSRAGSSHLTVVNLQRFCCHRENYLTGRPALWRCFQRKPPKGVIQKQRELRSHPGCCCLDPITAEPNTTQGALQDTWEKAFCLQTPCQVHGATGRQPGSGDSLLLLHSLGARGCSSFLGNLEWLLSCTTTNALLGGGTCSAQTP